VRPTLAAEFVNEGGLSNLTAARDDATIVADTQHRSRALRDGARHHESIVVVGVLADEVDASGSVRLNLTHRCRP
jgi:hypothetical protein